MYSFVLVVLEVGEVGLLPSHRLLVLLVRDVVVDNERDDENSRCVVVITTAICSL